MDPSDIPLCDSRTGVPQFVAGDTPKVYGDGEFFSHGELLQGETPLGAHRREAWGVDGFSLIQTKLYVAHCLAKLCPPPSNTIPGKINIAVEALRRLLCNKVHFPFSSIVPATF